MKQPASAFHKPYWVAPLRTNPQCQHGAAEARRYHLKSEQCQKDAVPDEFGQQLCEEHYAQWFGRWGGVAMKRRELEAQGLLENEDLSKANLEQKRVDEYNSNY